MYSKIAISAFLRVSHVSPPDQFSLDGFEERFDSCIVIAIALSAHRHLEAMLAQDLLIVVRTILRSTVRMMDAALGRCPECDGHLQRPDRQVTFHPVADRPADHAAGMQVQDHGQIQPAFARPDIADVTSPFLVWCICVKSRSNRLGAMLNL